MNLKQTSVLRLTRVTGPASLLLLGLAGILNCDSYSTHRVATPNCPAEADYVFHTVDTYETVGSANLWTATDTVVVSTDDASATDKFDASASAASATAIIEAIPEGPRCGSTAALVLRAANNNDWGCLFGFINFGPRDESAYEGISFWAKAAGNTGRAFTVLITDSNTQSNVPDGKCIDYDAGVPGQNTGAQIDPSTGTIISGNTGPAALPDQCGNGYTAVVEVTGEWRLHTIPWSAFHQTAQPNRVPNAILKETGGIPGTGINPAKLHNLTLRMPKEARMEVWIDNLSFYRRTGAGGGADAGANLDASQG